ncbi:hypothetical protein OE88DRAFT_1284104 [Heliocybe sulcata]|uniref:Uncharacterized protein n=1 Tax=Heliocybe sulcata TaxID=5364 RepID=A0A5C3NCV3_9AGAM|nr:hypothetical protein OE88DRAFT_1284104 [Heliocybe sulcata]
MSSFFNAVFACCLRAHSPSPERPDETTHLIPAAQDVDIPPQRPHVVVVDPQKMKERLGTIVRSKEGKMVNVHSPAPFNVQNRAALPNGQSSTSRSTRYPSPQPSLQTSRSTTSLQHDAAAVVGAEDDGSGSAALNVRLRMGMGMRMRDKVRKQVGLPRAKRETMRIYLHRPSPNRPGPSDEGSKSRAPARWLGAGAINLFSGSPLTPTPL